MNNFKFAIRQMLKNPGFTIVAVLTLAIGIGATGALFSVAKALVLDPFPFPDSDRIVYVRSNPGQPLSTPDFRDIREQSKSFEEFGVYRHERLNFGAEKPEPLYAVQCTASALRTFGMQPILGRWLNESDEQPGAAPVAIISNSLWTRSFASDPGIVGRTIRLNSRETTVVGVMPKEFEFPSPWYRGHDFEIWVPLILDEGSRGSHWLLAVGRLKKGVTVAAADAEIKTIGRRLTQAYPDTNSNKPLLVQSMWEELLHNTASRMKTLFGAVCMLLLVACTNVASMMLARGARRQSEFGVRLALGVSQKGMLRLLLTESLLLGLLGSAIGILFAFGGAATFRHLIPAGLIIEARRAAIQVDATVLFFSVGLAILTALLSGLLPAFTAARTPIVEALNSLGRSHVGTRIRHRFLRQLVAFQIAVAVLLANGAILLFASYLNVFKSNQSMDTDQVLSAQISLGDRYSDPQQFWDRLIERVQTLPGVQSAGVTSKLPLEGGNNSSFLIDDQVYDPQAKRDWIETSWVSPGYFKAVGLAVLRGRAPERTDVHENSLRVVINRTMADRFWPKESPIGGRIRPNGPETSYTAEVIGVVEDVRQWGSEYKALPEIYFPNAGRPQTRSFLVVRASADPKSLVPAIRKEVAQLDGDLSLAEVRTMKGVLNASTSNRRMSTTLINIFMALTLLVAATGIYGTLSYDLQRRRNEIGLRIAVGAQPRNIFRFVLRQAGLWLVSGLLAGVVLTVALSFVLRSMVFGVSPLNPVPLSIGLGVVVVMASVAFAVPTWRAIRVDPMEALRCE